MVELCKSYRHGIPKFVYLGYGERSTEDADLELYWKTKSMARRFLYYVLVYEPRNAQRIWCDTDTICGAVWKTGSLSRRTKFRALAAENSRVTIRYLVLKTMWRDWSCTSASAARGESILSVLREAPPSFKNGARYLRDGCSRHLLLKMRDDHVIQETPVYDVALRSDRDNS